MEVFPHFGRGHHRPAGVILAVASIVMAVPKDEKAEALEEVLPGANCACGFSGCPGLRGGHGQGRGPARACVLPAARRWPKSARKSWAAATCRWSTNPAWSTAWAATTTPPTRCCTTASKAARRQPSSWGASPAAALAPMGLGDCQRACQYGAITVCNGLARIDPAKCKGCSQCVAACPKGILFGTLKKQAVAAVLQLRQSQGHHGRAEHWVHRLWQVHAHLPVRRHHRGERPGQGGPPKVHRLRPVRGSLPPACDCDAVNQKRGPSSRTVLCLLS